MDGTLAGAYTGLELVGWTDPSLRVDLSQLAPGGNGTITIGANSQPSNTIASLNLVTEKNVPASFPLAKYVTDPDGDFLSATVVTAPGSGSVTSANGVATYTPNTGFVGADSFTFRAVDPSGAASSLVTVSVTVNAVTGNAPNILNLAVNTPGAGTNTITYAGYPNVTYHLERTEDMGGTWSDIAATTASGTGVTSVLDTNAPPSAFYRMKRQ